jgi:hypothetical protein
MLIMKDEMWDEECQLFQTECLPLQERNKAFSAFKFKTCAKKLLHFRNTIVMRWGEDFFFKLVSRGPLIVAQWLGYCATNRKVAGSIPGGVIGISH